MYPQDHDFISPDGGHGLRLFGFLQINPPQSLSLILRYRIEIVKNQALGESGIRFEEGQLYMFPALFEEELAGPLEGYRAHVRLDDGEWNDPLKQRKAACRHWYWTDDSRYLVIVLGSTDWDKHNIVAAFALYSGQCCYTEYHGLPEGEELREIGRQLIHHFNP